MTTIVATPTDPALIIRTPRDETAQSKRPDYHARIFHGVEVSDDITESLNPSALALANYVPTAGPMASANDNSRLPALAPPAGRIQQGQSGKLIDSSTLIEGIATEWENQGVNPAWVKAIRAPHKWMNLSPSDLPALQKLADDLPPGCLKTLRDQAIQLLRDTPIWQKLLNDRKRANDESGVSRTRPYRQLVAEIFGRKNSSPERMARIMYLLFNAPTVSDALKTRGPNTWDALLALNIPPAQAWDLQWRDQQSQTL